MLPPLVLLPTTSCNLLPTSAVLLAQLAFSPIKPATPARPAKTGVWLAQVQPPTVPLAPLTLEFLTFLMQRPILVLHSAPMLDSLMLPTTLAKFVGTLSMAVSAFRAVQLA